METTTEEYIRERHDRRMNVISCSSFAENDFKLFWDILFPEDYEKKGIKVKNY